MSVEPIPTPSQSWAAGPYSTAVRAGDWIVCSGQVGIDPATGNIVMGGIEPQARQALANMTVVLADAGATWADVAKVTLFVGTMSPQSMDEVNAAFADGGAAAQRAVRQRQPADVVGITAAVVEAGTQPARHAERPHGPCEAERNVFQRRPLEPHVLHPVGHVLPYHRQ